VAVLRASAESVALAEMAGLEAVVAQAAMAASVQVAQAEPTAPMAARRLQPATAPTVDPVALAESAVVLVRSRSPLRL
jgi:hypothetical protein